MRTRRARAVHGTDSGYYKHLRTHTAFPEDLGGEPCGCRAAHSKAVSRQNAARRERGAPPRVRRSPPKKDCPLCGTPIQLRSSACQSCAAKRAHPPEDLAFHGTWLKDGHGVWRAA